MKGMTRVSDVDHSWQGLSTAIISDCLDRFQVMDPAIRSLTGGHLIGPAYPVLTMAGENSTLHRAVVGAPVGSVLVVDAGGYLGRAVWGEVLTVAAEVAGIRGVVIDGAVRDFDELQKQELPVFARGACAAGPHKGWQGRIGQPIQCGGVPVSPGDLVVGDGDGVVVVPSSLLEDVHQAARDRLAAERSWIARIRGGETTLTILGLD